MLNVHEVRAIMPRVVGLYLTDDLRAPQYRGNPNPVAGHCYVACEVIADIMPWLKPAFIRHEGQPHWFLYWPEERIVFDPTASQFATPVPYENGVRKGFLTKQPSKRAKIVLDRVMSHRLS